MIYTQSTTFSPHTASTSSWHPAFTVVGIIGGNQQGINHHSLAMTVPLCQALHAESSVVSVLCFMSTSLADPMIQQAYSVTSLDKRASSLSITAGGPFGVLASTITVCEHGMAHHWCASLVLPLVKRHRS